MEIVAGALVGLFDAVAAVGLLMLAVIIGFLVHGLVAERRRASAQVRRTGRSRS